VILLDEPEPVHYGGYTAAPVLLNTVRRGASGGCMPVDARGRYFVSAPELSAANWSRRLIGAVAPWVSATDAYAATESEYSVVGAGEFNEPNAMHGSVTGWDRLCGTAVGTARDAADSSASCWPDVTGLSLRDALAVLRTCGADARIGGSGVVMTQLPKAFAPMGDDRKCRLTLR
jgi:hypothetical protein